MNRHALAQLAAEVWAIYRPGLRSIVAQLDAMTLPAGASLFGEVSAEQCQLLEARSAPRLVEAATRRGPKSGVVAVVPIRGPIMLRDSLFTYLFGGTSVERLIQTMGDLGADESVSTIVLDIDSPGGTSAGLVELAATIRAAAETKNVVAVTNPLMASAAYWIGSQADEIVAPEISMTGSIGCYLYHEDWSGAYEQMGINPTYIYTPEYKIEGFPEFPLTDEAKADMQRIVDAVYGMFVADVAAGRKVDAARVREQFGKGRVMLAKEAKAAGLIDRVATFNQTLRRLTGSNAPAKSIDAADPAPGVKVHAEQEPDPGLPSEPIADDTVTDEDAESSPDAPADVALMRTRRWRVASL